MANIGETINLKGEIKTGYAPGVEQWTLGQGQQVKILNSRTQNGQLYYDIQHIGGGTGWVAASSLDSAINTPQPSQISSQVSANQITAPAQPTLVANQQANVLASMGSQVAQATTSLTNALSDQQKQVEKELQAQRQKESQALDEVKKLTDPFREKTETDLRAKYGTEDVLADQRGLLNELDQLLTQGNELIRQQQEVTGLSAIRNPRVQKTMDDVLARAGVIEAVVNLQNTYLANAYQAIDRTVTAITGDRQDRINYYSSILELANRDIVELTTEKRNLAQQQIGILQYNLEQGVQSANYIKELMVSPDTAMAMAKAGITLNDSVEQINAKLATYQNAEELRTTVNQFTSVGAQEVYNPSGVPAHLLVSFTDSNGKTHYFRMPEEPEKSVSGELSADDFLSSFKIDDFIDSLDTKETTSSQGQNPPNYSPSHIGATYIDPVTGDIWQYNNNGWEFIG